MTTTPEDQLLVASRRKLQRSLRKYNRDHGRESFAEFFKQAFEEQDPGRLEWWWHHQAMCDHLQAGLEDWDRAGRDPDFVQRFTDLVVNIGPITLKSKIYMVAALPWIWLRWPRFSGLFTSGTPSNVDRDSLACRDLVMSRWYIETYRIKWDLRGDLDRVAKWGTSAGGVRESRGMASSWTGVHVDGIFVDDPDDAAGVHSAAARRDTELSIMALGNRLNDLKRPLRFYVQQNLHAEDATSKLVKTGVPRLCIPLEYKAEKRTPWPIASFDANGVRVDDPRETEGQVLQPSRFTPAVIAAERRRLGPRGFNAQYNEDAASYDNGMFGKADWRFFRMAGEAARARPIGMNTDPAHIIELRADGTYDVDWVTITIDATFGSLTASASRVGLALVLGKGLRRFVYRDKSRKRGFKATLDAVTAMLVATYDGWSRKRPATVLIEKKANGAAVIEQLTEAIGDGKLVGPDGRSFSAQIEAIEPEGGKAARANAMEPEVAAGMWHLHEGAEWLEKGEDDDDAGFLPEVLAFPNSGVKNDRVDMLSQVHAHFAVVEESAADKLRRRLGRPRAPQT